MIRQLFSSRTDTGSRNRIKLELTGGYHSPSMDRCLRVLFDVLMTFAVFLFLIRELGVSLPELIIWYVSIDLVLVQVFHVGFVGKTGIGGNNSSCLIDLILDTESLESSFDTLNHRC